LQANEVKTYERITRRIPVGKDNAVSLHDLSNLTRRGRGVILADIQAARCDGLPIVSDDNGNLFFGNAQDVINRIKKQQQIMSGIHQK
jgi:biotin operon repressor